VETDQRRRDRTVQVAGAHDEFNRLVADFVRNA
jgi:hypothetical protein